MHSSVCLLPGSSRRRCSRGAASALAALAALACAGLLAACGDTRSASRPSYFLRTHAAADGGDLVVRAMTPYVLTPTDTLDHGPECPDALRTIVYAPGGDSAFTRLLAHIEPPRAPLGRTYVDARAFRAALADALEALEASAQGRAGRAPAMALVKHYPLPAVPGRAVALHTTLYTVADPHFAVGRFTREVPERGIAPGVLLEVRACWQLAGDAPRLVEAMVEVSPRVERAGRREGPARLLRYAPIPDALRADDHHGGHFEVYGGGRRLGLYWCDRALGRGPARPFAVAYRIQGAAGSAWSDAVTEPLDRGDIAWLLATARGL